LLPATQRTADLIIGPWSKDRSTTHHSRRRSGRSCCWSRGVADGKCPVQLSLRLRYAFGAMHDGGLIGATDDHCNGAVGCHGAFRVQYSARGRPGREIGWANGRTSSALTLPFKRRARHRKVTDPVARKHGEHPEKCRPRCLPLPCNDEATVSVEDFSLDLRRDRPARSAVWPGIFGPPA